MRPSFLLGLAAAFLMGGTAAASAAPRAAPRLHVVATLPDLAALAREVAGERAAVAVLLRPGQDPLSLVPQPEQALVLSRADLLVSLGGPLEAGWLGDLLPAARNPRLAEYLDGVRVLEGPAPGDLRPGEAGPCASRPPGSYPPGDPRQAARLAEAIAAQLAVLDPGGAAGYRADAAALALALKGRQKEWLLRLGPLRGQRVVTYDDSFCAFLCWAGLVEVATLAPRPGVPPGAVATLGVLRRMREAGARIFLSREYEPAQAARVLAEQAGAQVVVAPLGARFERGERYADGIDQLVHALLGAFYGHAGQARREP